MARIEDYSFGRVTIDGEEHTHDVIVLPRRAAESLRERGVEIEVLPTEDAVRRYGTPNPAATAAALHLTC
jgi:hypothetical protein